MHDQDSALEVRTIDDIFVSALSLSAGVISPEQLEFADDFIVKIRLKGDQWDGKIDYKIARFVLNLQHSVFNVYNKTTTKKISYKSSSEDLEKLKIKVEINKGSTELIVAFTELLKTIQAMPSNIGAYALIGIGGLCGFYALKGTINGFHERAKEIAKIQAEKDIRLAEIETQNKFSEIVGLSLKAISESARATSDLAKSLSDSDTITVNNTEMSKKEAIDAYYLQEDEDDQEESMPLTAKIDEKYQIKAAFMEKQEVQLSFKGIKSFKATTKDMPSRDKESLYRQCAEADMLAISPSVQLQINVSIKEGVIEHASIIKIDEPRPGVISIFKALDSSMVTTKKLQKNRQGNLLTLEQ